MSGTKVSYLVSYYTTQHYLPSPFYYLEISVQAGKMKLTELGFYFYFAVFTLAGANNAVWSRE